MVNAGTQQIVITGIGLVSAAGSSQEALLASLRAHRSCLRPIRQFDTEGMRMSHAGEVEGFHACDQLSPARLRTVDRGSQMALEAARQALAQAGLWPTDTERGDCGVAVGVSGAHQYQNMPVGPDRRYPVNRRLALFTGRSTPAFQADLLARQFALAGPRLAFGAASAGGVLAIAHAMDLLRQGHARAMLVGGGEVQTLLNAFGMDLLGLTAAGPCTPFSGEPGMCFGDAAAFLVLEDFDHAEARAAQPLAELLGAGISADAYHDIANDPVGSGLARAVRSALAETELKPSDIAWVRACGSGNREQDVAEKLALDTCFDGSPPPVTTTEPYFGHINGVSPLLGTVTAVAAQCAGLAPAMPVMDQTRPGCELPWLTPGKLPQGDWLLTAIALGGNNGALIGGPVRKARAPATKPRVEVGVAGIGVVSALGCDLTAFQSAWLDDTALAVSDGIVRRVDPDALPGRLSGVNLRRRENLVRWAMIAAAQAMKDAGLQSRDMSRVGLLLGLVRGPSTPYVQFFERALRGNIDASTARLMLKMGRFSVASELVNAFGLRGYCGTLSPGVHGGVQLLGHGAEMLRGRTDLDALLVLAADEWSSLQGGLYASLGLLDVDATPYAEDSPGTIGGEGAAAVLLERNPTDPAKWGRVLSSGFGGDTGVRPDAGGTEFAKTVGRAVERAGVDISELDFALGQGCGWPQHDGRELAALARAGAGMPVSSVLGHTGMAEGAGGLFSAVAALLSLRHGRLTPARKAGGSASGVLRETHHGDFHHALLLGSTERGAHGALVLAGAD